MAERKMRLTQWLCANRHAAYAIPWDSAEMTQADIEQAGEAMAKANRINPWCGICGGPIAPETGLTHYTRMDELLVAMRDGQVAQMATRALLDAQAETFDSRGARSSN